MYGSRRMPRLGHRIGRKGVVLVLIGAASVACAVGAPLVSAGKSKKIPTNASKLTVDADSVSGSLQSPSWTDCKRGRTVRLRSIAGGKTPVAKTKTNNKGRWEVTIQLGAGTYFAEAPSATRRGRKNGREVKFVCRAVKSAPVTL